MNLPGSSHAFWLRGHATATASARLLLAALLACLALLAFTPAASAAPTLSRENAEAFAKQLEQAVNTGDPTFFQTHFAFDALLDSAIEGLSVNDSFAVEFRKGIKDSLDFPVIVGNNIRAGGHYKFLRLTEGDGPLIARFRLTSPEGLNYHDLYLRAGVDGQPLITDVFIWRAGERLQTLIRRSYVPLAAKQKGDLSGLNQNERAWVANFTGISEFQQLLREEKYADALAKFDALPTAVRSDKSLMLLRFRAAAGAGDKAWRDGIDAFRSAFPGDPAVDVVIFDGLFAQERYPEALNALNRVDRSVGGDAYLNVQRGAIMLKTGNLDEARARGAAAAAVEPDLLDAYWIQLVADIRDTKYEAAVKVLDQLVANAGEPPASLEKNSSYKAFVTSPQYQNWKRARKDK